MAKRSAELVLGSVQLGLTYGVANKTGKPSHDAALRLARQAADAGVTQFDTARAYGDSETRLGEALDGRAIRAITKLSPLADLPAGAGRDEVRDAVDASIDGIPHCAQAQAHRLSAAASRQSHERVRRRYLGTVVGAARGRQRGGAGRVGAVAARSA